MKWFTTALWLSLLATACQGPTAVSPELEAPELEAPELEASAPEVAAPDPAPASATPIKTGTVQAQPSLRIHKAPGTDTPMIYAAPNGTQLDNFAETAMGDSVWYQVRSNLSQEVGWAYGGNIRVEGDDTDRPPVPDSLAMSCTGTFSNGANFTINYTPEAGFSRFTLDPTSTEPITVNLSYAGKTDAQHDVWKGSLGESEVRVDHLSNQPAKPGDEVNVLYNIFDGRGTCR